MFSTFSSSILPPILSFGLDMCTCVLFFLTIFLELNVNIFLGGVLLTSIDEKVLLCIIGIQAIVTF